MTFDGPVLLLTGPLLAASIAAMLSRWRRLSTGVGVLSVWLLWGMVASLPLAPTAVERAHRLFAGDTFNVLGRLFVLTEASRSLILVLYAGTSLLFLLSLALPQGRLFVPGVLASLWPLASMLMIQQFAFGALFLLVAVAMLAIVIQAEQAGSTRAALRYLVIMVVAVPLFLIAGWMLAARQPSLLPPASRLLLLGIAMLLAGFPFHIWVGPIVRKAPPLVAAFVLGLVQLLVTLFVFDLIQANPALQQSQDFIRVLRQSALATAVVGGLLALTARRFQEYTGALLLLDMGLAMLALTLTGAGGRGLLISLQLSRFASMLFTLVGLHLLQAAGPAPAGLSLLRRAPLGAALFVLGAVSLLGLPLSVGFAPRWAMFLAIQQHAPSIWVPVLVLLSMLGAIYGLIRALSGKLAWHPEELPQPGQQDQPRKSSLAAQLVGSILLIMALSLTLFPSLLTSLLMPAA